MNNNEYEYEYEYRHYQAPDTQPFLDDTAQDRCDPKESTLKDAGLQGVSIRFSSDPMRMLTTHALPHHASLRKIALTTYTYQSASSVPPCGVGANADGVLAGEMGSDRESSFSCVVP